MEGVRVARKSVMETKAWQGKIRDFPVFPGEDKVRSPLFGLGSQEVEEEIRCNSCDAFDAE